MDSLIKEFRNRLGRSLRTIFLEFERKIAGQAGWKSREKGDDRENATPFENRETALSRVPRKMCLAFGQYLGER